jgi:hypothetical protein
MERTRWSETGRWDRLIFPIINKDSHFRVFAVDLKTKTCIQYDSAALTFDNEVAGTILG